MKNIIKLLALASVLSACSDLFEPGIENNRDLDAMYKEPVYAQGILGNAYILLPYSSASNSDVATDDAVSNKSDNNYQKMTTGSWASNNDPMSQWQARKNAIQYLNIFLERTDKVEWSKDAVIRTMYNDRLKGEAYGLRALQMYYLLQAHGGWTADGRLLGVPVVTVAETSTSNFNVPRNTFKECLEQIFEDAKKAVELLPLDYNDVSDAEIPAKYKEMGVTNASNYNRVNGSVVRGRITGRIVEAVCAQVALLAASPAYSEGTGMTWGKAADYAAVVLNRINGVSGLAAKGGIWYTSGQITGLSSGGNVPEVLWRSDMGENNDIETENFPPSLYGKGSINPTQNLVDAFPMLNGYPVSNPKSGYNSSKPYADRDPRLANYIIVNEGVQGPNGSVIVTGTYGTNNDALNKENALSTRTGYYLRKLLRHDCNPNPEYNTKQKHYTARIRYTEMFLAYAEAANEAYGPAGKGTHAYSAYEVVKAIRARAGIGATNGDAYLESIKNNKNEMRELIRNERRLELCFENFRFWDLRRWKVNMNETTQGIQIDKSADGTLSYTPLSVETRNYKEYMYYGPVPYSEILKWDQLEQNKGW